MANDENLNPIKKGERRNPNGRPKGSKNMTTLLKRALEMKMELAADSPMGKKGTVKRSKEMVAASIVNRAIKGDMRAAEMIFDRIDGKVTQPVEGTGENGEFKFVLEFK